MEGSPHAVSFLDALATTLNIRLDHTDSAEDLDEIVKVDAILVAAHPENHPERPLRQAQHAFDLHRRYARGLEIADLRQAVHEGREALAALPKGDPNRALAAASHGLALADWFHANEQPADLDEAIRCLDEGLARAPAHWPGRRVCAAALGSSLLERFRRVGDRATLDRAVDLLGTASPHRLGEALLERFDHEGRPEDLDEVIDIGQAATHGSGDPYTLAQAMAYAGLAAGRRYGLTGSPEDLDLAAGMYERIRGDDQVPLRQRIWAAHGLALVYAKQPDPRRAAEMAAFAVRQLDQLVPQHVEPEDQQRQVRDIGELGDVGADAAALALDDPSVPPKHRPRRALELLELGRGMLLSKGIEFRTDPAELHGRRPDLAERLTSLRRLQRVTRGMGALGVYWMGDFPDATLRHHPDPVQERRQLGAQYAALLEEIRSVDGFASFAKPPSEADLPSLDLPGAVVVFNISELRSDALVLHDATVECVPLPRLTPGIVAERVDAFRQALDDAVDPALTPARRIDAQRRLHTVLQWLWDDATEPVLATLGHVTTPAGDEDWPRVWWAPGGRLGNLPIHAAGHHTADDSGRSVLDRVVSSYTPTIRALAYARAHIRATVEEPNALIVAMPTTPDVPGQLDFVADESRIVHRYLPSARLLVEPEDGVGADDDQLPTRHNVMMLLNSCSIVHFACHGFSDPIDPGRSTLLLHDHRDNPLTVAALATAAPRQADLAYLSACETAHVAADRFSDHGIPMTSAFQLAGYANVIGTLWPINDPTAAAVAKGVYAGLAKLDGTIDTTAAARVLHRVVRRARADLPHLPALWAAHVHAGA